MGLESEVSNIVLTALKDMVPYIALLCRFWLVETAEVIHVMKGHTAAVNAVAVTDDGGRTISASSDATVNVWNTDRNSRLVAVLEAVYFVASVYVRHLAIYTFVYPTVCH